MEKADGVIYYCKLQDKILMNEKMLAKKLLKQGFWDFFHVDFQEEKVMRSADGKPYYGENKHLHFNISHCAGGAAVALSCYPVGVDAETMRKVNERTVRKCCGEEELSYVFAGTGTERNKNSILTEEETRRFLELWTLKESCVKMTGEGLRKPLDQVCFDPPDAAKTKENRGVRIEGKDRLGRHYLYQPGNLILAFSVQWEDKSAEPDFVWKEISC